MNTIERNIIETNEMKEMIILDKALLELRKYGLDSENMIANKISSLSDQIYEDMVNSKKYFYHYLINVEGIYKEELLLMTDEEKESFKSHYEDYISYTIDAIYSELNMDN